MSDVDLDFLSELLAEPEHDVSRFERPEPKPLDKTVTAVVRHFASVQFTCSYYILGLKCKHTTHYLYLGQPRCLSHMRLEMETHTEQDVTDLWEGAKNI